MEEIVNCKMPEGNKKIHCVNKIDQITLILCPENLENSKVISILNENLTLKTSELFALKDMSKIFENTTELVEILENLAFLKISKDKDTITYNIDDNMISYSIINIPQKITKIELLKQLEMDGKDLRLFKKSIFWILTVNTKDEDRKNIEKKIKSCKFQDGTGGFEKSDIKYDLITKGDLLKTFSKHIQTNSYKKESGSLKAADNGLGKSSTLAEKKDSSMSNNCASLKGRNDSEAFSWRKPSNNDEIRKADEKNKKETDKAYYNNNSSHKGFRKDSYKRERFNSEGNSNQNASNFYANNSKQQKLAYTNQSLLKENSEIEIDLDDVKYSMKIKHAFSLEKMAELYEIFNKSNLFKSRPAFNIDVEDLYTDKKKEVKSFTKLKNGDRSNTMTYNSNSDAKYNANYNYNGSNYYDRNRTNSFYNNFDGHNPGLKIPMVNPLSNIQRNHNKYDDYDFNSKLSEIKLEENNYHNNKFS